MVPPCVVVSILGVVGCCVPFGWSGLFPALGRSAPGAPPTPAGEPGFLWKKAGGKNTRALPWTRVFMAARSHSLVLGVVVSGMAEGLLLSVC